MWLLIHSESKKLLRDARLYSGAVLLLLLLWYGFHNRAQSVQLQKITADSLYNEQQKKFADYILLLDSLVNNKKEIKTYTADPRNPVYYSQRLPLFAQLPLQPLSILATGQSDLYNEHITLNLRFRDPRIQKQDISNPLLIQFGLLDAAMVLVVLLPLFIIALSYNFLSGEKESGTLSLIAVQSGALKKWVTAKTILYGSVTFVFTWLACTMLMVAYGFSISKAFGDYTLFSLLLLAYVFFWQLLAVYINGFGKASAFNALALVSVWLLFVFVLPAAINLLASKFHPVPSRVAFINTLRVADVEAERADSSKLVDQFFYDHPELAEKKDTAGQSRYAENAFWKEIVVQQEYINKKAEPVYNNYNEQLKAAGRFANTAAVFSPSGIFYKGLIDLSGSSTEAYLRFNDSAMNFRNKFLDLMRNKIVTDKEMSLQEAKERKTFSYPVTDGANSKRTLLILAAYVLLLALLVTYQLKNKLLS